MSKNLVIVESPAKAKTIENYLGKDFQVKSSFGHVRDLPKDDSAIDIKNDFKPTYEISKDKQKIVNELKKIAKNADTVYLASDDDREGEAISWHLVQALSLEEKKIKRIVFREITKKAIINAIENPRKIDLDLVNAQQARRILDRLVGFELSPILWRKIKGGLSAGRVQSVAVRLIVEREREIAKFTPQTSYKTTAVFVLEGEKQLLAELPKRWSNEEDASSFLNACVNASFSISKLDKKQSKRTPSAPFTTSTLQQEANRMLGFSVSKTMTVAQRLYEAGKISYMRTDSFYLSEEALSNASEVIVEKYGQKFHQQRTFKSKNQRAQEAHEAIRPTNFKVASTGNSSDEQRLYTLIWKRTIASQMSDAELEKTNVYINISTLEEELIAKGEVIKFEGFLKVYITQTEEDDDGNQTLLPPVKVGETLDLDIMKAKQIFSKHAPRYTEAGLVKTLEEKGIGRPSTYAPTITTIQKREYVEKRSLESKKRPAIELVLSNQQVSKNTISENHGADKNKLFPTNTAMVVNDFLEAHFPDIIDYGFTANIEDQFDDIASGQRKWGNMIDKFYGSFHPAIEKTKDIDRSSVNKMREIGIDTATGKTIYARHGKYGAMVQLGELVEGGEKPKYASLKPTQFIDTVTLEEALDLFKLPREAGEFEEKPVIVADGRYGPYVKFDKLFASLNKEQSPLSITLEECIELIVAKREEEANKYIKVFDEADDVFVLNGKYGPYIKFQKKNVKIPKDKTPESLTYQECCDLAEKAPEKKGRWKSKK